VKDSVTQAGRDLPDQISMTSPGYF
jgi:hypothetical protein